MAASQHSPFGSWLSPITSDLIVALSISLQDVMLDGQDVYWVEGRPQEAWRYVLVRRELDGTTTDVNPQPINARTRVHEYGGAGALVVGGVVYLSNFSDQRLYRIAPGAPPTPITPAPPDSDASLRYADGRIDVAQNRWVGVRQDHLGSVQNPQNTIVAVDLEKGGAGRCFGAGQRFLLESSAQPGWKETCLAVVEPSQHAMVGDRTMGWEPRCGWHGHGQRESGWWRH
jgi:hypothetical protein